MWIINDEDPEAIGQGKETCVTLIKIFLNIQYVMFKIQSQNYSE